MNIDLGKVGEIRIGASYLGSISERGDDQAFAPGLKYHDPLALRHDDAAAHDHVLAQHGISNDRERVLANLVVRDE